MTAASGRFAEQLELILVFFLHFTPLRKACAPSGFISQHAAPDRPPEVDPAPGGPQVLVFPATTENN
jgi:hypothetical protein